MTRTTTFTQGSGVYTCNSCGRRTRDDGNGDAVGCRLCTQCFEVAGFFNMVQDNEPLTPNDLDTIRDNLTIITNRGGSTANFTRDFASFGIDFSQPAAVAAQPRKQIMAYIITDKANATLILGEYPNRDAARAANKVLKGVIGKAGEQAAPKAPKTSILDMAKTLAETAKVRTRIGKKDLTKKRVELPASVLADAAKYLRSGVKAGSNKVTLVRALASWKHPTEYMILARRDMMSVFKDVGFEISPATISTQFQLVRSGKLTDFTAPKAGK